MRWAFAVIDLGIPSAEFWDLDNDEYAALEERWLERERRHQQRLASIRNSIHNTCRKNAISVESEFPDLFTNTTHQPQQTPEEMRNVIRMYKT